MQRMPYWRVLVLALGLSLALPSCSLPGSEATLKGYLYGQALDPTTSPAPTATPDPHVIKPPAGTVAVSAQITCNGVKAATDANGIFTLHLSPTTSYSCSASSASYQDFIWKMTPPKSVTNLLITFTDTGPFTECSTDVTSEVITCPILKLKLATLSGVVRDGGGKPQASQEVRCGRAASLPAGSTSAARTAPTMPVATATTDAAGHYSMHVIPGTMRCYAATAVSLTQIHAQPGASLSLDLHGCASACGKVTYHDGRVMHHVNAYIIFWLPPGTSFEPNGSDGRFESLMKGYFADVNGSALSQLMSQYGDYEGPVMPDVHLVSTYLDTAPYPQPGTRAKPLTDTNIEDELSRVVSAQQWPTDETTMVAVFTGYGIETCTPKSGCTFGTHGFCAYHSDYQALYNGTYTDGVYLYIPVTPACVSQTYQTYYGSPHGDPVAEAAMDFLSHEHFETVTDPFRAGWYGADASTTEVGDLCVSSFGTISHSSNVSLNGHPYLIQSEWSAKDNGCRFG